MADKGWIKLYRKITEGELWDEKPYDRAHAWVDILLMVNHEGKNVLLGNEVVFVERGSKVTSIRKLGERWGWSNNKVVAFLRLLQSQNMLIQKCDTKKTVLTVVNYDFYQSSQDTDETAMRQQRDTNGTRLHTNKNVKNEKNEKNINKIAFGEFVKLSAEEHAKLVERFGEEATKWMIDKLDNAIGAKGYHYKSHYRAILNWVKDDYYKTHKDGKGKDKPKGSESAKDKYENFYL